MQRLVCLIKKSHKLLNFYVLIMGIANRCLMFIINKIMGVNDLKVVFISFGGKSYSDNPKAISEKMHEICTDFEIIWLFRNPEEKKKIVPDYVRCVKYDSFKSLKELATAKFWVDNFTKPMTTYKAKKQIYIQTWHGDRGFKKILYDARTLLPNGHYEKGDLFETAHCDLIISGSDYGNSKYKSAFNYSGHIMTKGCPRNDLLVENNCNKSSIIRKQMRIADTTGILLYAPTLRSEAIRENKLQVNLGVDLLSIIKALEKRTNKKWLCLVRAHSAVKGLENIPNGDNNLIDVTSYEDMSDLLMITDFLITDYSSCAGDFVLLNRPLVLYQPDREQYTKQDRQFYFDVEKSPYMIAKNQSELFSLIDKMDWESIPQYCKVILEFYGTVETGRASEEVVKYIQSKVL